MHEKVDGMEIGQHALVSHLLKGASNSQPPLPCYDAMWDVKTVTTYLSGMRKNESLSLQAFTQKLVMLFSLTRPSWVADLAQLNLHIANSSRRGVFYSIRTGQAVQTRKSSTGVFVLSFPSWFKPISCTDIENIIAETSCIEIRWYIIDWYSKTT